MTTAHRPTFDPARGGTGRNENDLSKLSVQYSSKDMPSQTTLKFRQPGQAASSELRGKDLRRDLEDRERQARTERRSKGGAVADVAAASAPKKARVEQLTAANIDADDPLEDDDDDDESDEDDTAELMAELNRIKKERATEKASQEAERQAEEERIRTENILQGNPLLNASAKADFKVKRRWDDDVVFKNCAKGIPERAKEPTFINDAIRSEFHKKFMTKYIQ